MTTIELVRHAEAQRRDEWQGGPDIQRPLTPAGRAQAAALADELAAEPVVAVLSSPFARCIQTVAPLAERLALEVVRTAAIGEVRTLPVLDGGDPWVGSAWLGGRALRLLGQLADDYPHGRVVVCTHGDVLSATLAVLAGRDVLDLSDVSCQKGGRYTLRFDAGRCVRAAFVPAPST